MSLRFFSIILMTKKTVILSASDGSLLTRVQGFSIALSQSSITPTLPTTHGPGSCGCTLSASERLPPISIRDTLAILSQALLFHHPSRLLQLHDRIRQPDQRGSYAHCWGLIEFVRDCLLFNSYCMPPLPSYSS